MKSLLGLSRSLFLDLRRLHPDVRGLDRDLRTIGARIESEGDGFLSVALPAFGKALDQSVANGKMAYIPGFARNGEIPKFLSGILCHIFDTKTGVLKEDFPVEYYLSARQVCYFFKKFLPRDVRAAKLELSAIRSFKDTEAEMEGVNQDLLSRFGRVCAFLVPELDEFQDTECRHGPGAVLEGYTPNQKWSEVYNRLLDIDGKLVAVGYDLPAILQADRSDRDYSTRTDPISACAKLVTVPKSCTALRTITVEPCLNQFVQQGLNEVLRREMRRCPILRHSIALDSQVPNQVLALEGSLTGEWSTVDLSSASDLLSTDVVRKAFETKPRFLEALMLARTPKVRIFNEDHTLIKFAGMGNATTFPVQSLVFAALAITSMTMEDKLSIRVLSRAANDVRVFGDDIVIKTALFQRFADWISCFDLKINRDKTFAVGHFRESCGVDAYKGKDVTPVYLRYDPEVTSSDTNALLSLVSTSNQLWMKAYYSTSEYIRHIVERQLGALPLVSNTSPALGWHTRLNARSGQRWHPTLHRFEVRSYVPTSSRRKDVLGGYPALIKFFHQPVIGPDERINFFHLQRKAQNDEKHLSESVRKFSLQRLRKRWVQS